LPPRPRRDAPEAPATSAPRAEAVGAATNGTERLFAWIDRVLSR
jgi:hypothetical protein